MVYLFLFYFFALIISAFVINGFYAITTGRWEIQPDGSRKWVGKIFKSYGFWIQRHSVSMVPYENDEWIKIYWQIKSYFDVNKIIAVDKNYMVVQKMDEKSAYNFYPFCLAKGIKVGMKQLEGAKAGEMVISAYKEVNNYVLPEWVRAPLGHCINCMASTFGTVLFIFFLAVAYNLDETEAIVLLPWYFKIGMWVLFCLILSHLNEYVFNLNNNLKNPK